MSSTRKLSSRLTQLLELFNRNDDWLIVINADPDAMASAMALKRIMSHRTGKVTIARINEISRPDNLAMIRYLRIPMLPLTDKLKASYSHFAMVDSQPHHNPAFAGIQFSIVIDHHPAVPEHPVDAAYVDIRPQYGAVSILLTEYLRAYHIRPGIRLATALQYGIRTDTATFTRTGTEIDLRAYQYLAAHGDTALLTRITRSEYLPEWLKYFARAFSSMHQCGSGAYCYLDTVENPDVYKRQAELLRQHLDGGRLELVPAPGGAVGLAIGGDDLAAGPCRHMSEHRGGEIRRPHEYDAHFLFRSGHLFHMTLTSAFLELVFEHDPLEAADTVDEQLAVQVIDRCV